MLSKMEIKRLETRVQEIFWELYIKVSRDQHLTFEWSDFRAALALIIAPNDNDGWEIARAVWWRPENRKKYHQRRQPLENYDIIDGRLHKAIFIRTEDRETRYRIEWILIH